MDILRTLFVAGLAVLLWRARFRDVRPVRDFVLWGANYPFHFGLMSLLILVIWGGLGTSFGLQGLFLENNSPTQVLLGAALMLLFAALILHYSVLDSPGRWWNNSLKTLVGVLRDLNAVMPAEYPVQRVLRNGFLEKLDRRQIEVIDELWHRTNATAPTAGPGSREVGRELAEMLRDEPFRLLVSPAILLIKGVMLVFLAGLVPAVVIPLLNSDPTTLVERLPWLVGVLLGDFLGIVLACLTTRWAARAAGWQTFQVRLLQAIEAWTDSTASTGIDAPPGDPPAGVAEHGVDRPQAADRTPLATPRRKKTTVQRWESFLFAFFAIHFLINVALPERWTGHWIDWPERTYITTGSHEKGADAAAARWSTIPWLPMGVMLAEALGAAVLVLSPRRLVRGRSFETVRKALDRAGAGARGCVRLALQMLSNRTARRMLAGAVAALGLFAVVAATRSSPTLARSLREGVGAVGFLGGFLALWVFAFRIATWTDARNQRGHAAPSIIGAAALVLLVLVYLAGAAGWLIVILAAALVLSLVWRVAVPDARGELKRPRGAVIGFVLVAACGTLAAQWLGRGPAVLAALWVGLAILALGACALAGLAPSRPALLYPLTLLLAFTVFAVPYNSLDARWQSAMPAAGSIACMVALVAAAYTMIAFFRPKGTVMTAAAVVAAILVVNGNAWFVDPNQFKTTFPHMEAYYASPVYLNSGDYFRETTPSAVRLRDRELTSDLDHLEKVGPGERLATAYVRTIGQQPTTDGGHVLRLTVEDPHGRLRAGVDDEMRLASEEWYTTRLEGPDCVVLAEEPFYRKIFRWFRYEKVQLVRDGIVRGQSYALRPAPAGGEDIVPYDVLTGPGSRLGLRLRGLADAYRKAGAEYVLISMSWSARVATVRHSSHLDTYEIDFDIPPGYQPLDASQMQTMRGWLQRCHLDVLRPAGKVTSRIADTRSPAPPDVPGALPGDCLVLEDARAEAPVPVGTYLVGPAADARRYAGFAPYWPTRENLLRNMAETPPPAAIVAGAPAPPNGASFTLRPAHDRGIFATQDRRLTSTASAPPDRSGGALRVALYNARRLRPGDRLIFSWNGQGVTPEPGVVRQGATFEVAQIEEPATVPADAQDLPAGYRWTRLLPVAGSGPPPSSPSAPAPSPLVGEWQLLQPLNNTEVLLAWKQLVGDNWTERKPKLVIVTVSGGGIRASVWTSVVLRKLEQTLGAEFPYHIRLITGASGGMVGGSYYATSLKPPPPDVLRGGPSDFASLHGISPTQFVDQMATNQLDAVAGRMVFADLISPLNPYLQKGDRGQTLEHTWIRWTGGEGVSPLARSFQSLANDERLGWRPSMVYTPMMVEDGRRLLVSNLDLAFATRNVGGLLIEPSSRKIDRPAFQGADLDRQIHDEDDVFSLSAVEFYRLFPEAHEFRVTTAVRMSASFPWVSPAVSLPTLPPRRVVDAGYYDNYGVNLAALWLSKMRSWLEANTSGVVIIQIRDHVSQDARTEIDFDRLTGTSVLDRLTWNADRELVTPGIQAISTPLLGISNARQWTMSFRNDEQVDLLDLLFDDEKSRDFFRTVVFECPVEASLNWQLSAREKEVLSSGLGPADVDPHVQLGRITDYLTGRDSYEFHKWKIAHANAPSFQAAVKARYARELHALGIRETHRLTARQAQQLYENIVMNLKRLELLRDWWREGRTHGRRHPSGTN